MDIVEELRTDREKGAKRLEAEYKAGLMSLALRFCPDPGDAEELVNSTFAAVVDYIDEYVEQSAFFAWMCQILTSKFSRSVRRKSARMEVYPGEVPEMADDDAQEAIYRNLDTTLLREAIDTLPQDLRKTVVMHYFMDVPVGEIAKLLSISSGTVKWRLHHARLALAAKLGIAAKKPGVKALVLAIALCGLVALGAGVSIAVGHLLSPASAATEQQQADNSKGASPEAAAMPALPQGSSNLAGYPHRGTDVGPPATPAEPSTFNLRTFNHDLQGDTMNTTTRTVAILASALAVQTASPLAASAKTVALWPMEYDSDLATFDGRCATSAAYDLTAQDGTEGVAPGLGWSLPPNPDASGSLFPPLNNAAIAGGRSGAAYYSMSAPNIGGGYLANTNAFTVEGWVKLAPNPSQGADYGLGKAWTVILQSGAGSASRQGGWILSWRGDQGARKFWLTVPADSNNANGYDSYIGPSALSAEFEESMANSWHHLALTHKVEGGQDVWKLYIDGENSIDGTYATVRKSQSGSFTLHATQRGMYFGGRPESAANRINASFDYWRVSDEALEPQDFLCAAAPAPAAGESAVAHLAPIGITHSQWISTGVSLKGDARRTCTVEIWVYPLPMSYDHQLIEQYGGNAGRMNFSRRNSDGKLRIWLGDCGELLSNSEIPLNAWSHVAWVADDDTWRLYVNGNLDAESTGHTDHLLDAASADGFVIGNSRSSSPNGQSNAYFAEARVWKCARTGAEIKAAMNARIADAWAVEDLIGYWPLNDGAVDYALNGNKARNYAVLDGKSYTPSGAASWNYAYALGNRVGWTYSALPVTGVLHGDQNAIYNLGVHTNAVNTQVNATPDSFTIMGWYHVLESSGNYNNYLCAKTMSANGRMQFNEINGALRFWMGGGSNGKTNEEFIVADCMPIRRWAHVAVTKSAGTVRIYVNGELVGANSAFTMNLCPANLHLGGFDAISSRGGFAGAFRNVGFWSKALSPSSIKKHMTALPDPNDENLLGYWPLDEGTGDTVRNLRAGGEEGIPVSDGHFLWTQGANMPMVTGTVKKDSFVICIR